MRASAFALLLAALPASHASDRLDASALARPGARQSIPFAQLIGAGPGAALDFAVEIPAIYRPWEPAVDLSETLIWCRLADWSRLRRNKPHSGRYGALVAQRSELMTWNARTRTFRDGDGRDERDLSRRFESLGAKNVRIERLDAGEVPVLLLEADIKPTERLRVVYVALPEKTRMLYYLPQRPWSEGDELVWGGVRDSLAAASGSAR